MLSATPFASRENSTNNLTPPSSVSSTSGQQPSLQHQQQHQPPSHHHHSQHADIRRVLSQGNVDDVIQDEFAADTLVEFDEYPLNHHHRYHHPRQPQDHDPSHIRSRPNNNNNEPLSTLPSSSSFNSLSSALDGHHQHVHYSLDENNVLQSTNRNHQHHHWRGQQQHLTNRKAQPPTMTTTTFPSSLSSISDHNAATRTTLVESNPHEDHHHYEDDHHHHDDTHNMVLLIPKESTCSEQQQQDTSPHDHDIHQQEHNQEHHSNILIDKYLSFEQHLLRRSDKKRDNQYRTQLELITAIDEHCDSVLHTYSWFRLFILSLMGGVYVAIGTLTSGLISSDLSSKALQKLLIGIAFVGAFTMIIFSRSILFTEVNISVSVHLFKSDLIGIIRRSIYWLYKAIFTCCKNHMHVKIRRISHKSIKLMTVLYSLRLWGIAIIGNVLGTVLMSAILNGSFVWYDNISMIQFLASTTYKKVHTFSVRGVNGWFSCLLSGMIANFMIGVATLLCSSSTTIVGKIIALSFPIIAFAALGVQHAPANLGYFSHIFIWKELFGMETISNMTTITPEIYYISEEIQWWDSLIWNVIPAGIGNAIGGVFLAFIFVYTFIK
ncbi:hypothetical protein C9374_010429 [Naegleria lovaniensis]|uniref:Formate/nitrite transporter n=1 Tax=Naegleria lovaniensis TaxID=51637 RepID=A0AA88GBK4_NAELO|nr:uncharacterized protein C9374_010429 [Naegleria lovaniensis]KAG2374685.1 hypothetical protein C9374_010429 [Naegleria lovaniensis]